MIESMLKIGRSVSCRLCSQSRFFATALRDKKGKSDINKAQYLIDWRKVRAIGGSGGNGCQSFLQLWCNPNAGPDGGDGGNGGHVIFLANSNTRSLSGVTSVIAGFHGEKGGNKDCIGKSAEHTFVKVPKGTIVKDENGQVLADLTVDGDMFVAARGGAGGKGNHYFISNENKAPMISEVGAEGERYTYILEMKAIAHAGLIGFPNAGKSTLLRAISRARPKVAAYPFTTLNPYVGIVHYDDYEQLAVADIPGLIPGAHKNRGLGISFLKHVERCLCLLYVIDLSLPEPWFQLEALKFELEAYQSGLSSQPHAILGNKLDLPEAQHNLNELRKKVDIPVLGISAKNGTNLSVFLRHLRELYDAHQQQLNSDLLKP